MVYHPEGAYPGWRPAGQQQIQILGFSLGVCMLRDLYFLAGSQLDLRAGTCPCFSQEMGSGHLNPRAQLPWAPRVNPHNPS